MHCNLGTIEQAALIMRVGDVLPTLTEGRCPSFIVKEKPNAIKKILKKCLVEFRFYPLEIETILVPVLYMKFVGHESIYSQPFDPYFDWEMLWLSKCETENEVWFKFVDMSSRLRGSFMVGKALNGLHRMTLDWLYKCPRKKWTELEFVNVYRRLVAEMSLLDRWNLGLTVIHGVSRTYAESN